MKKVNLLFNANVLLDAFFEKNGSRTGIYFVAWNILKHLQQNKAFHITLTCPLEYMNSNTLKKLKRHPFFSQFKFISTDSEAMRFSLLQKIEKYKKQKKHIKVLHKHLRLSIFKLKEKYYCNKKFLEDAQFYISPYTAIPNIILEQRNIKKIYFLYDAIPLMFPEYFPDNSAYNRVLSTLNKDMYYFCISQSCKDDFLKYCGDKLDTNKMFVTHLATNNDYFPNYDKQKLIQVLKKYKIEHNLEDKYLFSLCSLEPRKNLPFTITCFLKFIKKHNIEDLYFYLGGSIWKNFETVMAESLEEAGELKNKIKLLGYIDDEDTNILYSNSLFFSYLSQYEGFGMPPLEAMQAGTPVITSNNSSLPEVVGDAAISLTYNDEQAVIKSFEDFYFNENLRNEYIAKGLERAKMFSWEKTVEQIVEVMSNVSK